MTESKIIKAKKNKNYKLSLLFLMINLRLW